MEKFRLIPLLTAAVMGCTALLAGCGKGSDSSSSKAEEGAKTSDDGSINKDLTATELARLLGNGTNLGNTMEAYGHKSYSADTDPESFETFWGQPVTTEEMIKGMKASGFDSLRVPVAWTNAMEYEKGDYTINEAYLDRVEEIINYALDNDMYVIINDHWDGSWWGMFGSSEQSDVDKAFEMYKSMWTQIANRYKKYSDRLIFEGANEELGDRLNDTDVCKNSGSLSKAECYEMANKINQTFVDTVRATGGNNEQRFLLIAGYNTDITMTCSNKFQMPTDTAKDKLLLSVHYYTPWDYCGTNGRSDWGTKRSRPSVDSVIKYYYTLPDVCTALAKQYGLSKREETVLQLLAQKKTASDIATELFISIPTVKTHTQSIYRKFDIHSRAELLALLDAEMPVSEEAD